MLINDGFITDFDKCNNDITDVLMTKAQCKKVYEILDVLLYSFAILPGEFFTAFPYLI